MAVALVVVGVGVAAAWVGGMLFTPEALRGWFDDSAERAEIAAAIKPTRVPLAWEAITIDMPPDRSSLDGLGGAAYADGRWVATGHPGILVSDDGRSWSVLPGPPGRDGRRLPYWPEAHDVAYGGGHWAVVGAGYAANSEDGVSWQAHWQDVTQWEIQNAVAFGDGQFVAVGRQGAIFTSPDGATWTERDSGWNRELRDIAFGGGRWVVVSDAGLVLTSEDGVRWTRRDSTEHLRHLWGVAYGDGQFVAVGEAGVILTSADGLAWTRQAGPSRASTWLVRDGSGQQLDISSAYAPNSLAAVAHGPDGWIAVGNYKYVITSPDGVNWTIRDQTDVSLSAVAVSDRVWLGLGVGWTVLTRPVSAP